MSDRYDEWYDQTHGECVIENGWCDVHGSSASQRRQCDYHRGDPLDGVELIEWSEVQSYEVDGEFDLGNFLR